MSVQPTTPPDYLTMTADAERAAATRAATITRIRDIIDLYRKGLMERPWGSAQQTWDAALLEDLLFVRSCFIAETSEVHLSWWLKPMRPVVEHLDGESLVSTGRESLSRLMDTTPMLMTENTRGRWIPTHAGRRIVTEQILPQWHEND